MAGKLAQELKTIELGLLADRQVLQTQSIMRTDTTPKQQTYPKADWFVYRFRLPSAPDKDMH